ncbi:MAG: 4a-hydroxytetrahydrobiopterin dehydratase [Candidatus Omnitrophota bacterium]|jgi:4a-hydroxytetrahydrobiopterin dehydratase
MGNIDFKNQKCQSCEGLGNAFTQEEALKTLEQLPKWQLSKDSKSITRQYVVKNFMTAIGFLNTIAEIAEGDNHHPDLALSGYRNVTITLTTHALKGLSINDFIVAAKINELSVELKH